MSKQFRLLLAIVVLAVSACGGGEVPTPSAPQQPLLADLAPQPPQAFSDWNPSGDSIMQWAEAKYPQFFPAGPRNRFADGYTYRLYPQTGNYLAVAGDAIFIHGPVAGGVLTRVGTASSMRCQIDPAGCAALAAPAPAALPAAATTPIVPSSVLTGVTAILNFPQRIEADVTQGQRVSDYVINGFASGNVQLLSGRTIYILVEDPHSLFEATPRVGVSGTVVNISLTGKTMRTAGVLQGSLKIYVCLDPQCSTALAGSPISLPYKVVVTPAISTDVESIGVFPGFGEIPAVRNIRVNLPPGTYSWAASLAPSFGSGGNVFYDTDSLRTTAVGNVAITFRAAQVGTYTETLIINGVRNVSAGSGVQAFNKSIPIIYTVNPNPSVDVVMAPVETVVPMKFGESLESSNQSWIVLTNTDVTLTRQGLQYVSAPAAAAGHYRNQNWWLDTVSSVATCWQNDCLPPGTYVARMRYTKTKAGVSSDVYHVITMQIYP